MSCGNESLSRRAALLRLGRYAATAYVVPNVVILSEARASGSGGSGGGSGGGGSGSGGNSGPGSGASNHSSPTPPSPPTAPSNVEEIEADEIQSDLCKGDYRQGSAAARDSLERAQQAVDAGYARPLDSVLRRLGRQYNGRIVGVSFTGFRWRPRYRFRAVSASGRLETVIVSARTGKIVRIEGC